MEAFMNKDKIAGSIRETGGKIRRKIDHAFGDKKGEALGARDEMAGRAQKNAGKLKDSF
jgi:uncharacterized protein YjbJ (UPF0337 family)